MLLAPAPHIVRPLLFVMPHDSHLRPGVDDPRRTLPLRPPRAAAASAGLAPHRPAPSSGGRRRSRRNTARVRLRGCLGGRFAAGRAQRDRRARARRPRPHAHALRAAAARRRALARHARGADGDPRETVSARAVVNATGPWVTRFIDEIADTLTARGPAAGEGQPHRRAAAVRPSAMPTSSRIRTAGSCLRSPTRSAFTLIGTTDVDFHGDPGDVSIDAAERAYLLAMANRYFARDLSDRRRRSGATRACGRCSTTNRPMPASVTRDYSLELECDSPPLLSVFGGKITTYRRLAEEAVDRLAPAARTPARGVDAHGHAAGRRHAARRFRGVPAQLATARDPG